jgi:multiple sugar transport system substrate-binding protein
MKKRNYYPLMILLIIGLILAACNGQNEEPTAEPAANGEPSATEPVAAEPAGEKITIRLATWAGVDEAAEL